MKNIVAVILAAGVGSRLRELVVGKPKCMVYVNGEPIVSRQIKALLANGIERVVVVTGYCAEKLEAYVADNFPSAPIKTVHNSEFAETNNMYSLCLAESDIRGNELLLLNGDVAIGAEVIARMLSDEGSRVGVDLSTFHEESMKVVPSPGGDFLGGISKKYGPTESLGSSIDVYRFSRSDTDTLLNHIVDVTGRQGRRKEWTEVAIHELMGTQAIKMRATDVSGLPWFEIDNPDDLASAEALFGRHELDLGRFKIAFVDMDGTLYVGRRGIPGGSEFVSELRRRVGRVYFLSNNSSRIHAEYVSKLAGLGIEVKEKEVVLSTDALVSHLRQCGVAKAFVLGSDSMRAHLVRHGLIETEEGPGAVILGYDTNLTYDRLATASILLQDRTVAYFATHPDMFCPTERGPVPDAGAIAELLRVTTGRQPDFVVGKPNPAVVEWVLRDVGATGSECLFIGDRVYTDYALAQACGGHFIGVLSGDSSRRDFEGLTGITVFSSVKEVFGAQTP